MVNENNTYINGDYINTAMNMYKDMGYQFKSVPSCIPLNDMLLTMPDKLDIMQYHHINDLYFVGSAEQSFVHLYNTDPTQFDDYTPYMAFTPCMRGDTPDETHLQTFVKLELFVLAGNLYTVKKDALTFFEHIISSRPNNHKLEVVKTNNRMIEYDILLNDIEVGSYGIWTLPDDKHFVYGTAVAEPRLSYALSKSL